MHRSAESVKQNEKRIRAFLKKMGEACNSYIACYDKDGLAQVDFACDEPEQELLKELLPESVREELLDRVLHNSLEEQVVEETQWDNIKIAVSALKDGAGCRLVWFFCAKIEGEEEYEETRGLSRSTSLKSFFRTIDVMREIGKEQMMSQHFLSEWEEIDRKHKYSASEMAASIKRLQTLTEILQYLESDNTIEMIMSEFLRVTANYMNVSLGYIFKTHPDREDEMDVVVEWNEKGVVPLFDKRIGQKKWLPLEGKKPVILSSGSEACEEIREMFPNTVIKAVLALPIEINKQTNMYICFVEQYYERAWTLEDLQFLASSIQILQNVLEKRIQKNSLASSYASLEEIMENVGCSIIVCDPLSGEVLFENEIMKRMFPGQSGEQILRKVDLDREITEVYDSEQDYWYEVRKNQVNWVDGRPMDMYSIFNVTEKKRYQKKIEQLAYTDFLTGLFNRLCCERDLARVVDEAKKNNTKGMLLYLDLDDFKHINDGLGHQYGDVLLKDIGLYFKKIQGIETTCYRMGGDEFVIIIPPMSFERKDAIIEEIKAIFAKPWFLKDADYYCTMSMGTVLFPDDGARVQDLIQKADVAMYAAKKSGKNRVAAYSEEHAQDSNKRLDMEKNMRDATTNGYEEFEIYYQPIIDLQKSGTPCVGAEALIRWNSSELGFISPADFIPLAEYLGLINPIGNHVLLEACKTCKEWNDKGFTNYKINVNLSVVQLLQNNIVDIVADTIKTTGINPRNLTLEVTESLAINDMVRMKGILSQIRQLGVRIALDDFGTGYSSLNHIREIPLDVIKVDQSFVRELVEDDYSKSFIKMVAELAGAIGVSICVEGIEKMEQYKVLEGMKVRLGQGFYFGRPMPRKEFEEKMMCGNIPQ